MSDYIHLLSKSKSIRVVGLIDGLVNYAKDNNYSFEEFNFAVSEFFVHFFSGLSLRELDISLRVLREHILLKKELVVV